MQQNIDLNDQIELRKLLLKLWRAKIYIIMLMIVSVCLASWYLQNAERKYTIEYKLKPVSETKSSPSMAGLGGLASLAGIDLPSNSSNDFKIFKELITSVEAASIIFENKSLVKSIFKSEWNTSLNNYSSPSKTKIETLFADFKKLLTGDEDNIYIPPNARRLATFVRQNIKINEDKETGFLAISSETSRPDLLLSLIVEMTEASDKIMRQRYIEFSIEPLAFYKEKLRTARSREHRESLAELIGAEEQKLMFASRGKYFIAEPYINPIKSIYPTSPNSVLILAVALILGLFIGSAAVLIQNAILKENL
jgi:hypothetical protein